MWMNGDCETIVMAESIIGLISILGNYNTETIAKKPHGYPCPKRGQGHVIDGRCLT
jgi:hypothetical protein